MEAHRACSLDVRWSGNLTHRRSACGEIGQVKEYPKDQFASRQDYDAYLKCVGKMRPGDEADLYAYLGGFAYSKTSRVIRATLIGRDRCANPALLFGLKEGNYGWYPERSPMSYGFDEEIANWREYPKVWQINLVDRDPVLSSSRIAKIYRK